MQNPTSNYYPLRVITDRTPLNDPHILQLRRDFQNKSQNHTLEFTRPSLQPKPDLPRESKPRMSTSKERLRGSLSEDEYLKNYQKMEKKMKQLLRQALLLAEILNEHQISTAGYEKTQERLKVMGDSAVQEEYNKLKNKLYAIKWSPTFHKLHLTQLTHHTQRVTNPESQREKQKNLKTMRIQRTADIKVSPTLRDTAQKPTESQKMHSMKRSDTNVSSQQQGGKSANLPKEELEALTKKIDHYRHKANKCQVVVNELLQANETLNQINDQINDQNIKLRSQLLNCKYGSQKTH